MDGWSAGWIEVERLLDDGEAAQALAAFTARLPFVGLFGAAALLPRVCAAAATAGHAELALSLASLAGPAGLPTTDPQALAILAAAAPEAALLRALEELDHEAGRERSAALFEQVAGRLPPMSEYWVYFRMSRIYAALRRFDACFVAAAMALQMEPRSPTSWPPAQEVFAWFHAAGRNAEAARTLRQWRAAFPNHALTDPATEAAVEAAAGDTGAAAGGRVDRVVVAADTRQPQAWFCYGEQVPRALRNLSGVLERRAASVSEIADAQLLVSDDAVVVQSADGAVLADLCVGELPERVRRRLAERGDAVEQLALDEAVLLSDSFPSPNLCHFLLDQATRLTLYRAAGVAVGTATVIGPDLLTPYQREIAARFGAGPWLGTRRHARVAVRRLHVSSTCRALQHPAHWAAEWTLAAARAAFGVSTAAPGRRRLLVSRADASYRRLANEDAAAALLEPHGFERIVPGRMALDEQVAAFADASHVVAVHGAALANIVFCAPGARLLEVFPANDGTWAYAMLAPALGVTYASMVGADAGGGDVTIDLDELRRWLADNAA